MLLGREELLKLADELEIRKVKLDSGEVYLKELTGSERDAYEQSLYEIKRNKPEMRMEHARAKLLVKTICDKEGKLLFKNADIVAVGKIPAKILDKLFEVAQDMNGLAEGEIEEQVKN